MASSPTPSTKSYPRARNAWHAVPLLVPADSLQRYLAEIRRYPLLTREEEHDFRSLRNRGLEGCMTVGSQDRDEEHHENPETRRRAQSVEDRDMMVKKAERVAVEAKRYLKCRGKTPGNRRRSDRPRVAARSPYR